MEYKVLEKEEFKIIGIECETSVQECQNVL
ncbi:MAG: hypothetical protein FD188_3421, partial [Ignavibacteria bacterium]